MVAVPHGVFAAGRCRSWPEDARGGFFRQTSEGMSTSVSRPFYEVVSARAIGGGERRTVLDWTNVRTDVEVARETTADRGAAKGEEAQARGPVGRSFGDSVGFSSPLAEEIARRSIVAAAARTAVELGEQRQRAEKAAKKAEKEAARKAEEAARRAAELESARVAAEAAALIISARLAWACLTISRWMVQRSSSMSPDRFGTHTSVSPSILIRVKARRLADSAMSLVTLVISSLT